MSKSVEICKKICMLGSFGVGKTSLVRRYVYNMFDEKYLTTIGVQISQKQIPNLVHPRSKALVNLKLILWDLAHIEKFNEVIKNYYRGSHGAIVVYDLTRPESFERTTEFLQPFRETNPNSRVVFAANKSDLLTPDHANRTLFLNKASPKGDEYCIFTSAKSGEHVEEAFAKLGAMILEAEML